MLNVFIVSHNVHCTHQQAYSTQTDWFHPIRLTVICVRMEMKRYKSIAFGAYICLPLKREQRMFQQVACINSSIRILTSRMLTIR